MRAGQGEGTTGKRRGEGVADKTYRLPKKLLAKLLQVRDHLLVKARRQLGGEFGVRRHEARDDLLSSARRRVIVGGK